MIEFLRALFEMLNANVDDPVPYRVEHPLISALWRQEADQ